MLEPLKRLLRKDQRLTWGCEQYTTIQNLKNALVNITKLKYFDVIKCEFDASPVGLGAVFVRATMYSSGKIVSSDAKKILLHFICSRP